MVTPKITGLRFFVTVPLYDIQLLFMCGYDQQAAANIAQNSGFSDEVAGWLLEGSGYAGYTLNDTQSHKVLVHLPEFPTTPDQYGTVTHELFHATEMILHKVGISYSAKSSEAYAYVIGFLSAQVFESLWEAVHAKPIKTN